ncbi:MAG: hypothetical protein QNJ64_16605 [Crocosphaera sp.]|nr:hypothetical protein [Crocosphaera sp.]
MSNIFMKDYIPGYKEIEDWPIEPKKPYRIVEVCQYRDGGPQGGTLGIYLAGKKGKTIPFFFDKILSRLCYGEHQSKEEAAFIKVGCSFEKEIYDAITSALEGTNIMLSQSNRIDVKKALEKAQVYSGT